MTSANRLRAGTRRYGGALGGTVLVLFFIAATMLSVKYALPEFPIRSVRIVGALQHIDRAVLEQAINTRLDGGFFGANVDAVRNAVERLPWVREASVRRIWPDSLHIAVVERIPAARWGADQLIEADGTVFSPERGVASGLTELEGPPGSARRVLARYRGLQRLLAPLEGRIEHLALNARGTWRGRLDTGMVMVFEEGLEKARLRRFVKVASKVLRSRLDDVKRVDLRYANGFAVRWKMQPQQVSG
jgi:cell division protein FtsQ